MPVGKPLSNDIKFKVIVALMDWEMSLDSVVKRFGVSKSAVARISAEIKKKQGHRKAKVSFM